MDAFQWDPLLGANCCDLPVDSHVYFFPIFFVILDVVYDIGWYLVGCVVINNN
jgi:hypothetical protein